MVDGLFGLLFVVALLMPMAAGIWAYARSARASLLGIPCALLFLPPAGSISYVLFTNVSGVAAPFWVQRIPGLVALVVVAVLVRRLEVGSS